MNQATGSET